MKKAWPTSAKGTPFEVNIKHVIMGCMVQVAHSDSVLSIIVAISKLLVRLGNTQGVLQRLLQLLETGSLSACFRCCGEGADYNPTPHKYLLSPEPKELKHLM